MKLRILTLGQFQIERPGYPPVVFDTDKTRALLTYLALKFPVPQTREHLAGLFWSDQPQEKALHSLRQALSALRKGLENGLDIQSLVINQGTVGINPAISLWVDAGALSEALSGCLPTDLIYNTVRLDIRQLQDGLRLYRGRFLVTLRMSGSPLFEEWLILQQEAYEQQVIAGLQQLSAYVVGRGEFILASQAAGKLVELAPWDDSAHIRLMQLLALAGQFSAAQAQYQRCRRYMMEELGVNPLPETTALYEQVRRCAAQKQPFTAGHVTPVFSLPDTPLPLVGRVTYLRELSRACAAGATRLVTLVGPGGIGKSRLALETAREQVGLFSDGVFWVNLASPGLPGQPAGLLVVEGIAGALGLRFNTTAAAPVEKQLQDFLHNKEILLVLDNFEHLLPAAELCAALLANAPRLMLLVTSRSALNLHMEQVLEIGGLGEDSVTLFEQTARRSAPNFDLACEAQAVREICQIVGGNPLALESAAALVRSLSCPQIAGALAQDLDLLENTRPDIPLRHRSMRAVFEQSWRLLSLEDQALLSALSVFASPFDLAAAQVVGGAAQTADLPGMRQLAQHSLVRLVTGTQGDDRFDIHPMVKRFAAEKLADDPQAWAQAIARHAAAFGTRLAVSARELAGAGQLETLDALAHDLPDFRQAWEWMAANAPAPSILDAAEALYQFYRIRGFIQEGIRLFAQAVEDLSGRERGQPELRLAKGVCLAYLGALQARFHLHEPARSALEQAAVLLDETGAPDDKKAFCRLAYAGLARWRREIGDPLVLGQEALALYRSGGPGEEQASLRSTGEASALEFIGIIYSNRGELEAAQDALQASLDLSRAAGNLVHQVSPLNVLADLAIQRNDFGAAILLFEEALAISQRFDDRFNVALILNNLGTAYHLQEQYAQARRYYLDSLEIVKDLGDLPGQAVALNNLAELALLGADWLAALDLSRQALAIQESLGEAEGRCVALTNMAEAALGMDELTLTRSYLAEAVQIELPEDMFDHLGRQLIITAGLCLRQGADTLGRDLVGAASAIPMCQAAYIEKGCAWLEAHGLAQPSGIPWPPREAVLRAAKWLRE